MSDTYRSDYFDPPVTTDNNTYPAATPLTVPAPIRARTLAELVDVPMLGLLYGQAARRAINLGQLSLSRFGVYPEGLTRADARALLAELKSDAAPAADACGSKIPPARPAAASFALDDDPYRPGGGDDLTTSLDAIRKAAEVLERSVHSDLLVELAQLIQRETRTIAGLVTRKPQVERTDAGFTVRVGNDEYFIHRTGEDGIVCSCGSRLRTVSGGRAAAYCAHIYLVGVHLDAFEADEAGEAER